MLLFIVRLSLLLTSRHIRIKGKVLHCGLCLVFFSLEYNFATAMAVQTPTFDQASVAITRWYFNMRVDYLSEEELNQELLARSILLTDDFGVARKRKWVRND